MVKKCSVFWRIENFSLIGSHEVVESPSILLWKSLQFYLELDTLNPGERFRLTLQTRCDYRESLPGDFSSFAFYAQIAGSPFTEFHKGGKIGEKVRNGKGFYKKRTCLQELLSYAPHDTLTFKVVFVGDWAAGQMFSLTRIPETRLTFVWEIGDLSNGVSETSITSPHLRFRITKLPDSEENTFEVAATYVKDEWIDIPCVVYLMEDGKVRLVRFTMSPGSGGHPKGSFLISNKIYDSNVRRCVESSGKFTLMFEIRIRDGKAETEGFHYVPIVGDSGKSKQILVKSSSSIPSVSEEGRLPEEDRCDRKGCQNSEKASGEDDLKRMPPFLFFVNLDVESAAKLFAAVDTRQIGSLRSKCVQSLASSLSAESVCRALSLTGADVDASLMTGSKEFVFLNTDRVFRSDAWKRLMADNMQLARCVMRREFSNL